MFQMLFRVKLFPLRETKRKMLRFHDRSSATCILEYGTSLSCKRKLKRSLAKTGVSEGGWGGGGREDPSMQPNKSIEMRFISKTKLNGCWLCQWGSPIGLVGSIGELVGKLLKARNLKLQVFLRPWRSCGKVELHRGIHPSGFNNFFETWSKCTHAKMRVRFSKTQLEHVLIAGQWCRRWSASQNTWWLPKQGERRWFAKSGRLLHTTQWSRWFWIVTCFFVCRCLSGCLFVWGICHCQYLQIDHESLPLMNYVKCKWKKKETTQTPKFCLLVE